MRNFFIGKEVNREHNTLAWTVSSGIVYSLQSLLFLAVIMSVLGEADAGLYSVGIMIAQQMLTVGKYSIRNYQVSDVHERYSFQQYFSFRIVTCLVAMLATVVWIFIGKYSGDVVIVILSLTLYKMAECFSDVFEGLYQQKFRFDISGKSQFIKDLLMIVVYLGMILFTRDIVLSSVVLAVISLALIVIVDFPLTKYFGRLGFDFSYKAMKGLTLACFSLFVSSFLCAYIHNAPKYAIESIGSTVALAKFNALFMPVFAVDLLCGFTMRIWITRMALYHADGDERGFKRMMKQQLLVIAIITAGSMAVMYFVGGWLLSIIYNTDLSGYQWTNALLMLAGGMVSIYTLYENVIIIYRHQHFSIVINVISSIVAFIVVPLCTRKSWILGATIGYLIANTVRAIGYYLTALYFMKKDKTKEQ